VQATDFVDGGQVRANLLRDMRLYDPVHGRQLGILPQGGSPAKAGVMKHWLSRVSVSFIVPYFFIVFFTGFFNSFLF
jgi:hypothetical protein